MEKELKNIPIIDLEIEDDDIESGIQKISLVDEPAIEVNWVALKKETLVDVKPGESKEPDWKSILERAKSIGLSSQELTTHGFNLREMTDVDEADVHKVQLGKTLYKYVGPIEDNSRDFCREMVQLDLLYTYDQIQLLSNADPNPGFGPHGASNYDIWLYKGGPNCKHKWQKFYIDNSGGQSNKGPAPGKAGTKPFDMPKRGYLSKIHLSSEDKKELVGPIAIPDVPIYRVTPEGKEYYIRFSKDLIQKLQEKYMREKRTDENNLMHREDTDAGSYVFESWIVENEADKANTVYNLSVPVGTWCVKMKVVDDEVWKQVKAGRLRGFSMESFFTTPEKLSKELEEETKYKEMFDKLCKLFNEDLPKI